MTSRDPRPSGARILVVEDDAVIREAVSRAFEDERWSVLARPDGADLEVQLERFRPDLLVLDWMLPGRDGPTLASVAASRTDAGIVVLTARDETADRLRGFAVGADDYVTKPFTVAELVARVRAVLRRAGRISSVVEVGDLLVDEAAGLVQRDGRPVAVTATELRLLSFLAAHRGRVLSTTQILTQVWGYEEYADNLVQVHVSALRRKTEEHGPRLIHTVRGLGYVLKAS